MTTMASKPEPSNAETFIKGLWEDNPVFVMLLGMCPVLAVSNTVANALAMGLAATFVLVMSSTLVSLLRKLVPKEVRIATFIVIIATFVTIVDQVLPWWSLEIYNSLGAFVPLIVVNCIILGRAEAFASKNRVGKAAVDALGMGVGFTFALLCLGVVRELLGSGTLLGVPVLGANFATWTVMVLPAGGFFTLGAWLLVFNWWRERGKAKAEGSES
jgi:H+/Na+-translocating ferredoxin:NAD+ oxidoreductase subunit E